MAQNGDWYEKQSSHQKMDSSAVIDMEVMSDDASDYEVNLDDSHSKQSHQPTASNLMTDAKQAMAANVGSYVWQTGSQQARKAFSIYGNIDILRPYFDVEPHQVRSRLIHSLIPAYRTTQKLPGELYGPTMVVFTLIALLLFQMKSSGHTVQEGTLMGSAFAVCFGYWFGASSFVWFVSYVCNARITMLQIFSLLGYGLFGHCIVLFLGTVFHTSHDHLVFYLLWAVFGGLSTLKMISVIVPKTTGKTQRIIICSVIAVLHLLFLLYLHFAYHQIVEDLDSVLEEKLARVPIQESIEKVEAEIKPDAIQKATLKAAKTLTS
ncbi:unnamed protein product [Owenia fusiformis]|uniref:Protein YIPF3 n=1 Tax=Owenia fusiformis TaxID=6347 RepID=A0A8S4P2M8_OWEFU|nr:unnamed protein product [Owenia fusiformis]